MSFDFALKDFYRKKSQTYPYVLIIALVIALSIFIIYFTSSLGLNLMAKNLSTEGNYSKNEYFFSGSINSIYSQFNTLLLVLVLFLSFIVVVVYNNLKYNYLINRIPDRRPFIFLHRVVQSLQRVEPPTERLLIHLTITWHVYRHHLAVMVNEYENKVNIPAGYVV